MRALFHDPLISDNRDPQFTFLFQEEKYGFYQINMVFWIQLLIFVVASAISSAIAWTVTYHVVIPNRGKSTIADLVAYGIIIPYTLYIPFKLIDILGVENLIIRFFGAIYPIITFFHTLEAIHGYSPNHVTDSFKSYLRYNTCILEYEHELVNGQMIPKRVAMEDTLKVLKQFFILTFVLGAYSSIFAPELEWFETSVDANALGFDINLAHFRDVKLLCNNFIGTLFMQLILYTFLAAFSTLLQLIFKVKTNAPMKNPLFESESIADFWGNRWNMVIHGALKRGVFKPVYRATSIRTIALLSAFIASGFLHEYLLLIMYYKTDANCAMGMNLIFFAWNAITMFIEVLVEDFRIVKSIKKALPKPIISMLVVMSALPCAHFFLHPYMKPAPFLEHIMIGFPVIKQI